MSETTRYEAEVLAALQPGGQLTVQQLADATARGVRTVRRAVAGLRAIGQVTPAPNRDAWQLSPTGRAWLTTARGQAVIEWGRLR